MEDRTLARGLLLAALTLVPDTSIGAELLLRSAARVEPEVAARLTDEDGGRVPVIIVAREARGSIESFGASPTQVRRARADQSTAKLRELLSRRIGLFGADVPETRYLWVANAVATEVDASELDELAATGTVERVLLDRTVNWLENAAALAEEPAPEATNYGIAKIGADQAHSQGITGEGVVVAVIDTGIDGSHPALAGKVIGFKDFVNNRSQAYDDNGHGTHCAGTVAGDGVGVAPGAKLIGVKALNGFGGGSLSGLMSAMQYVLDPDGDPSTDDQPDIASNSWGADADQLGDSAGVFRDIVVAWRQAGIVPVFASGNAGPNTRAVPGGYPESFAVGATDEDDNIAGFSTGGPIEWDGQTYIKPDVSAPGVAIVSTWPGGGYETLQGTSMACPHVAGALALALQKSPGASVSQLQQAFEENSVDLGEDGRDDRFGEGRIDVPASLNLLASEEITD